MNKYFFLLWNRFFLFCSSFKTDYGKAFLTGGFLFLLSVPSIFAQSEPLFPGNLININGTVYFVAGDGTHGTELWRSNGTPQGTYMFKDINPGVKGSFPQNLTNVNGTLFFVANKNEGSGFELWKSDGTAAGTVKIKNCPLGEISASMDENIPIQLVNANGTLFFSANNGPRYATNDGHTYDLWKSDGTTAGTAYVKSVKITNPDVTRLYPIGNSVYFISRSDTDPTKDELWKSDGTSQGTKLVQSAPESQISILNSAGNVLYFMNNDGTHGRELWKTDGTAAGTMLVKDISQGPASTYFDISNNVNGTFYFFVKDNDNVWGLWKSDGTAAGTVLVKNISPSNYTINVNGTLFFRADDGTNGNELWKSNGTAAGTVLVKDIYPGAGEYQPNSSSPDQFANVNGTLFFTADDGTNGRELWKSNGTAAGTVLVKDIRPGSSDSYALNNLINVNGVLFFTYYNKTTENWELWKSDGSEAGTIKVTAPAPANCTATGSILREYWGNVSGTAVSAIPVTTTPTATSQLSSFEAPTNIGDNYGQRVRGYICAPATGNYTFYIAGDDNSELWLSTDDQPTHKQRIAHISGAGSWATARQWNKFASQKSAAISLVAGKKYYIEALQKEGVGGDNLAVGWTVPNSTTITVIPGTQLSPYVPTTTPVASVPLRLNSGGGTVVADGITFYEDKYFSTPSATSLHQKEVANTNRDVMYVDYRHAAQDGGSFSYNIPLNNGTYIIHLNFAEVYHTAAGRRVFSVNLEGGTVELPNFDVFAAAGFSTAITKIYTVTVSDGMLNVAFTSQVGKAMIGALQVLPASSARLASEQEVSPSNMTAYPNPFADKLTLSLAGAEGKVAITVTDVVGKQHYSTTKEVTRGKEQLELDLSGLKAGVYLLKLQTEDGTSRMVRVVKK